MAEKDKGTKGSLHDQKRILALCKPGVQRNCVLFERTVPQAEADPDVSPAKDVEASSPAALKRASNRSSTGSACVLEAVAPQQKISTVRREACQMMRFFVFGSVGNERSQTAQEKEQVFYESMGTMEKVRTLFYLWKRLDSDGSGRVDITEFRAFAEGNLRDKMNAEPSREDGVEDGGWEGATAPAWANINSPEDYPVFISKLCHRLARLLLAKKSSFVIEDVMRLIWPCAQVSDIKRMRSWCKEFNRTMDRRRARTPPILPEADFAALSSVFRYFDEEGKGKLRIEDLVNRGLIYKDQAPTCLKAWDKNADEMLDLLEFCEMMCPLGYRAHAKATTGSLRDGTKVVYDPEVKYWRLAESEEDHDDFLF